MVLRPLPYQAEYLQTIINLSAISPQFRASGHMLVLIFLYL